MRYILLASLVFLSGCGWMMRQTDALGEHMPTIGERCEHWQCFTESGQKKSDEIKRMKEKQKAMEAQGGAAQSAPAEQPQQPTTPAQQMPPEWYGDEEGS